MRGWEIRIGTRRKAGRKKYECYARIIIGADGAFSKGACERAACKWGPRDGADAEVLDRRRRLRNAARIEVWGIHFFHLERGHHLALFLAVYEVVVVLHRYERRKAIVDRVVCFRRMNAKRNQLFAPLHDNVEPYSASDGLVKEKGNLIRTERRAG